MDKFKTLKIELNRKEASNKDLKEKLESTMLKYDQNKIFEDENEKLKD